MITQRMTYTRTPHPPITVPRTNARRKMVAEMPNCSARPAHTPAIIFPSRDRYHVRVSGFPATSALPHQRHLTASGRISSAQYGHRVVGLSAMALLVPQTGLPLDEDRDGAVGEREEQDERRGVVEDEIEADRVREDAAQERVRGAHDLPVEERDERQRDERRRERACDRGPRRAPRVPREKRRGGTEHSSREAGRRHRLGRGGEEPARALDASALRAAAGARGDVRLGGGVAEEQRRQALVAVGVEAHGRARAARRRIALWRRLFTVPRGQSRMAATSSSPRSW